jgi:hypothetical protein
MQVQAKKAALGNPGGFDEAHVVAIPHRVTMPSPKNRTGD